MLSQSADVRVRAGRRPSRESFQFNFIYKEQLTDACNVSSSCIRDKEGARLQCLGPLCAGQGVKFFLRVFGLISEFTSGPPIAVFIQEENFNSVCSCPACRWHRSGSETCRMSSSPQVEVLSSMCCSCAPSRGRGGAFYTHLPALRSTQNKFVFGASTHWRRSS